MLGSLCCCFSGLSSSKTLDSEPKPRIPHPTPRSVADTETDTTASYSYGTNRTTRTNRTNSTYTTYSTDHQAIIDNNGYASVVSLPRYTPRPVSVHEKSVDGHMRSSRPPSLSSRGSDFDSMDEKHRFEYDPDGGVVADDRSSAFSFQSSYGNTSTATRETPPPPYSPRLSRAASLSISSQRGMPGPVSGPGPGPLPLPLQMQMQMQMQPMAQPIAQPRPVYQRPEWIGRTSPRSSVEGSRNE